MDFSRGNHPTRPRQAILGRMGRFAITLRAKARHKQVRASRPRSWCSLGSSNYSTSRFRISSALRTSRTSCSMTPVCAKFQDPSMAGIPSSGRLGGTNFGTDGAIEERSLDQQESRDNARGARIQKFKQDLAPWAIVVSIEGRLGSGCNRRYTKFSNWWTTTKITSATTKITQPSAS